ncbi:MAG: hypothetical protein ACLP50_24960 [Solirubrobacteraceae bacterium]
MDSHLYIVEVDDQCAERLAGHTGCSYASPPQPQPQALALVRALLSCPQYHLEISQAPWRIAIAGGQRTIRLHPASPTGQLSL